MLNEEMSQHADSSVTEESPENDEGTSPVTEELPTPPETTQVATPPGPPAQPPSAPTTSRLSPWLMGLLALLLVVGSSAATYLITAGVDEETAATFEQGRPESEQAPLDPGEEPVAAAAAVILPSVVQIQTGPGVGSGVIYDSDGLILTAAHVVQGNDTVTVRFADGEEVEGTVLGGTSVSDVAVVEVDRTGLPAADLALDEDPEVGQMAIAVGSPWGLQGTVTAGIISAVDQTIPQETPQGLTARAVLQTDAAINPGNSGGPLVDREGRVIGINVSIFSLSGANDGVGFAVPIDVASGIAERVVNGEEIRTAFLGVNIDIVESGQAGAVITEIVPGSAAEESGLEVDDLVISIDGARVLGPHDLAAQVATHQPGSTVDIVVIRDGEELTLEVTLGQRSDDLG